MEDGHPNLAVMKRFNPADVAGSADVLAEDVVFHFFNARLPDLQGDYVGRAGLARFFGQLAAGTGGSFKVTPVSIEAHGDELVVTKTVNTMTMGGQSMEIDAVVVWRILDGQITEAWDIPAVNTTRVSAPTSE